MTNPGKVRFALEARPLELAKNGTIPCITAVHSVVIEGGAASFGFDIERGGETAVMFFNVELPIESVEPGELRNFAGWLASSSSSDTMH